MPKGTDLQSVGATPPGAAVDYGAYDSTKSVKSELAIFNGPSYQVTHNKEQWLELAPSNQYQGTTGCNIIFKIVQSPGWYLDFNDSYILVTLKIENDGK